MDELEEARRDVKRAKKNVYSLKRKREETCTLTKWCLETALCIACICNYDFSVGYAWLQNKHRRGAPLPPHATQAYVEELLGNSFLRADVDHLMSWVDPPSSSLPRTVLGTATEFARRHALAGWVGDINTRCGAVVRTERLIEHFNVAVLPQQREVHLLPVVQPHQHPAGRKWAQRWRDRHGAKYGSLRVREPICIAEIVAKACSWTHTSESERVYNNL
jgi:hypothetical protein